MNCEKCNQPKKEVMLLTSSVWECQSLACSVKPGTVVEHEHTAAKDEVTYTTEWICGPCAVSWVGKSQDHTCGLKVTKVPTKASVAPLHLQQWRTLDEIYKEVGILPFTAYLDRHNPGEFEILSGDPSI